MEAASTALARGEEIPAFFFLSAHGGAGATTLARIMAPACDAGRRWPVKDPYPYVFVVATATPHGLDSAHQELVDVPAAVTVVGLVVVHHQPGKPSRAAMAKLKVMRQLTDVFEVPYQKVVRDSAVADLPVWQPGDVSSGRLRRKAVPPSLTRVAEALCRAFVSRFIADQSAGSTTLSTMTVKEEKK